MKIYRIILLVIGILICPNKGKASEPNNVSTTSIAELVLQKGLNNIDLGLYPGILLMHGMTELVIAQPDNEILKTQLLQLFHKYVTKEIKGRGNYISYEVGGSGAAMFYYLKGTEELKDQVADGARRMKEDQKRSTEGLHVPPRMKGNRVFIDMAFAVTPFYLYSGLALNRKDYIDLAVYETLELFRILEDKQTGLLHQGRGFNGPDMISEDNWSRGNGWGSFALSILVRDLPADHPKRSEVETLAKKYYTSVLKYQDKNGLWHQEMTDKTSYIETSGSGLLLHGLGIMLEKKLLNNKYKKNIIKGLRGYLTYIGCDGSVNNTCQGCLCPGKGTKEDYKNREWIFNDHHAFGPVVLAFTQAAKIGIEYIKPVKNEGCYAIMHDSPGKPGTYVRYVPERSEDIAWENDRIAYRVYGPPVKDKVGSGVDIWVKSVKYPIINKWYRLNAEGKSYHIDRGEGCDFYNVGFYRGCGGLAVWEKNRPYCSQTYTRHRILKNNKKEILFELTYNPWDAGNILVSEKKLIEMKKGSNFFKVISTINTNKEDELVVAVGLTFFENPEVTRDLRTGSLVLWEQVDPKHGFIGTALIVNPGDLKDIVSYGKDWFALIRVKPGVPFTYYAGACWDGNTKFRQKSDWLKYVKKETGKLTVIH